MKSAKIKALFDGRRVITENSVAARALLKKGFGTKLADKRVMLGPFEALYLVQQGKLAVIAPKPLGFDALYRKLQRGKEFWLHYVVFRDLTSRGKSVKTGLKFGGAFRVYDPRSSGKHARWIVLPVADRAPITWADFAAKMRVSHTAQKHLLVAITDDEDAVTYWDVSWVKP